MTTLLIIIGILLYIRLGFICHLLLKIMYHISKGMSVSDVEKLKVINVIFWPLVLLYVGSVK